MEHPTTPCAMCGAQVCTAEDKCDGSELMGGRWVCSSECFDIAVGLVGLRAKLQAARLEAARRVRDWARQVLVWRVSAHGAEDAATFHMCQVIEQLQCADDAALARIIGDAPAGDS